MVTSYLHIGFFNTGKTVSLTHWGRVVHICVSKVTIIVSDNGLSPSRHQAIIWNNAGILLIGTLWTNFSGILIAIHTFSFKKMHLKMSSGKWRPFCLRLNVLSWIRFQAYCYSPIGVEVKSQNNFYDDSRQGHTGRHEVKPGFDTVYVISHEICSCICCGYDINCQSISMIYLTHWPWEMWQ